ncbi:juvenile hormone acid O-methyltransferase-like [Schistocerca americana]|uniref:juvenile hormone acid O-methyltransferase-like n=1 Tax=Schistocerca americana TaxID=7009 RepID=UPI001F4F4CA5|nr:juvenile hormone acid O-methyltransferase-like [Schistocerca americana]
MDKPELYSRCAAPTFAAVNIRHLEELWPTLTWPDQPLPVLEVGCGPGDITAKFLAPRLPGGTKIVSCDVSPEMLRYAEEHNGRPGVITYESFDAAEKDLEGTAVWKHGPYSKAFALLLLHWVPDNRCAIQNIYRLLAEGGEAVFTVVPYVSVFAAYEEMAEEPRWKIYMEDVRKFVSPYQHSPDPAADLRQLLEAAGFQVLHCWAGEVEVVFRSEQELKEFLVSVNPFLNRLPLGERDDFIDDILQRMYKLNGIIKEVDSNSGESKIIYFFTSMKALAKKL